MLFRAGFPGRQFPAGVGSSGPPLLDFDFTKGVLPDSRMTFSRASSATYFDQNGVMQTAGNNVVRFDYDPVTKAPLGVLLEQSTANYVPNSTMVGGVAGTPGTLPTNWIISGGLPAGLSQQIVGVGTLANGLPYIDLRFFGTPAAPGNIFPTTAAGSQATSGAVTWTVSSWLALVGGTLNNVTALFLVANYTPSGNTGINIQSLLNSTLTRYQGSVASPGGTTAVGYPFLNIGVAAAPVDFTIRWAAPQLEQWNFATSFIPTTNAAATRQADDLRLSAYLPASVFSAFAEWAWEGTNPNEHRIIGTVPSSAGIIYCHPTAGAGIYDGGPVNHTNTAPNPNFIFNRAASSYNFGVAAKAVLNGSAPSASYVPGSTGFTSGTAIRFMAGGTTFEASNGWLKRFKWWTRALSDSELQALTVDPTLDIGFIDPPGGLDPRVSFTRASIGTYTDINKLMRTANSGEPRFDHDPITGAPLGLLVEESRTNLIFPSGDMIGLFGTPANGVLTSSSQLAPDGIQTMSRLSPTPVSGNHYTQKNLTVTASATYAFSIYAKAQEFVYLQLYYDDGAVNGCQATFDVLNGVVSGPIVGRGTGTGVAATIQPAGNGLYRCTIVGTAGPATAARCGVILCQTPNPGFAPAFVGDPSTGLLIWGAQFEQGAFSTSYIPTVGSSVIRAIDICDLPSSSLLNQQAGTLSVEFTTPKASNVVYGGMCASTGFSDTLYFASTSVTVTLSAGGGSTAGIPAPAVNVPHKIAASYTTTRLIGCIDGTLGTAATLAASSFPYTTRFRFGDAPWSAGGNNINGYVRRARYWPRALSDADLQAATR